MPRKLTLMVSCHTDALALLGHSQYELLLKRREAIRPSLKREYAELLSKCPSFLTALRR